MGAYLQTWTDGITSARERSGAPLEHAASNQYTRMGIAPGDVLYIAYLDDRRLHLVARLPVDELLTQSEAEERFGRDVWLAERHAVGSRGDIAIFDLRVPDDVVRSLRFERATGTTTGLNVGADGSVNGQALQSIRRLTASSAAALDDLLEDDALPPPRVPRGPRSAAERQAVELHAMGVVREHYEQEGWLVEDVSSSRPYDLVCRQASAWRHVEVKGLTGEPLRIELTANEVDHARACQNVVLAVVSDIELIVSDPPEARGGVLDLEEPWQLVASRLRATAFTYALA